MLKLIHHKLDPAARLTRLILAEYGVTAELQDVNPWRRDKTLLDINPAGTVPVLLAGGVGPVVGALAVLHHLEEHFAPDTVAGLWPVAPAGRAEMWRLVEWILGKLNDEVVRYVLEEKIGKRDMNGAAPDPAILRVAKANLVEHMNYFNWLLATRRWLAGESMTLADFALAAHLSSLDYLGDIDWPAAGETKLWYARLKSRPAFRALLSDRVSGMPPCATYADLDF